jgi:endo-1,4-beta-D-glucanase Y
MILRLSGYLLIGGALVVAFSVFYRNSQSSEVPLIYTPTQLLAATWLNYKGAFVEASTYRTIDTSRGNITTSEGQSYTMLRAVWMDDKATFDGAWKWTQDDIQHAGDHLFAWEWGPLPSGAYGVLTAQNGENSASDADTDIALSLVFAYARWQSPSYRDAARAIIQDIWSREVMVINGTPYLAADDVEKTSGGPIAVVNPSYLNPAAYRIFALVDPTHPWTRLVDSSYALLSKSMSSTLDTGNSDGLPPDWLEINKATGEIAALPASLGDDTNFGFDAMRVAFMLALDSAWSSDPRDKNLLSGMSFLSREWSANGALASVYGHDGSILKSAEAPSIYGGTIGYFMIADPSAASAVYRQKLLFLYNPGANEWKVPLSYYDDNWAWFGIALYNDLLPDLAAQLPASAFNSQ